MKKRRKRRRRGKRGKGFVPRHGIDFRATGTMELGQTLNDQQSVRRHFTAKALGGCVTFLLLA